ncbi:Gfo/Idh/MocA family protein [Oryzomicrobium sp.]|uniref:Gfo/Idh/MocA family protein n=1 Tax=Oryzomicrobium sp. TaxID=1911578 RepID=UPI002FDF672D
MSLGSIGQRHLRNLRATYPDAEIAVWRRSGGADEAPPAGADRLCLSLEEVLAFLPEAAIIASPASVHLEAALALAGAGVHLLVEKPLSVSAVGIDALIHLCQARDVILMVGYNLRFMPSLMRLRELVRAGAIGQVLSARAEVGQYLPDWRPAADYRQGVTARAALGGGVLLELSHDIDYLLWTLGLPARVTAAGGKYSDFDWDVEDLAELLLEYDNPRRLVSIHLDMLQRSPTRTCRVVGSEGVLLWDCIADRLDLFQAADRQWRQVDVLRLDDKNLMYIDQLTAFVDCVRTGRQPTCTGGEGRQVLQVVDAARVSIQAGQRVDIDWEGRA